MKNGWNMNAIDDMDFFGFWEIRTWQAKRKKKPKRPKQMFIDEAIPNL